MKMRQALLTAAALSVLLALAGVPAGAQDAMTSDATAVEATTVEASTTSLARSSAVLVPIRGIVSGRPESVGFSGRARVTSRLVKDPDFGRPSLLLVFDLSGVPGVGSSSGASYVIQGRDFEQRRLADSHRFEVTFPFMVSDSTNLFSARTGVAYFAINFDVNTGAITSAAARVAELSF